MIRFSKILGRGFQTTIFLFAFISGFHYSGLSQTIFTPAAENDVYLETLAQKYEKQYKARLTTLPSAHKKDYVDIYTIRWKLIKEKFSEKEVYTSTTAQQYLDGLVQEIVTANPILSRDSFSCFFSRLGTPNASYLGEGIILFNMGLFKRLKNESQVVFVICHELAHFYLQHSDKRINKYVSTINSAEIQKELRKIKNAEYGKREQLEKLVKGFAFNTRRHGRENENEADSMAVELMRATRFDPLQAVSALALLNGIDTDTVNISSTLQKTFDSKDYPFQKRWISVETGLLGGHATIEQDKSISDSLKTHPDCKIRMNILNEMLSRSKSTIKTRENEFNKTFHDLQKTFSYEIVDYAFISGNYSQSLYYAIEMLQQQPTDPYLVSQVGKIFNSLYEAQTNHTLGKFIELPSPYQPASYNLLLQFIQNLYREEYASISYHFLKQFHPSLEAYTPFRNAYSTSIQIAQR